MIGIYCIRNSVNGKRYIGQATNIWRRFNDHISSLNRNRHKNYHLQQAWNKYGGNSFDFFIIEKCETSVLDEREKNYISLYKTTNEDFGYNCDGGGNKNKTISLETRKKISASRAGKDTMTNEAKKRMSERLKGNKIRLGSKMSEENRRKLINSHMGNKYTLGYKHTDEARKKMSEKRKGKPNGKAGIPLSDETRKKISIALRNNKNRVFNFTNTRTPEANAKRSESLKRSWQEKIKNGYVVSDETKKKMRDAWERKRRVKLIEDC